MKEFRRKLISWYERHGRDLPWRQTRDPYKIWLSEVILQQTRINQGMSYYFKFIEKYPDVFSLASADEKDILKLWQGLGYYTRARNMHHTARYIVKNHNGVFPENYHELIKLKGIGEYTASAISSIAFNKAQAVIDGNVIRFLSRILGVETAFDKPEGKKAIRELSNEYLDKSEPGKYNQAVMDFGSTYCVPVSPNCKECIFQAHCYAFQNNKVNLLPQKTKKPKIRNRYFNYLVLLYTDKEVYSYLRKRTENDIWKNLYDFPLIETNKEINLDQLIDQKEFKDLKLETLHLIHQSTIYKHQLTHQKIHAKFYLIHLDEKILKKNFIYVKRSEINTYPVSRMIEKYLSENKLKIFKV